MVHLPERTGIVESARALARRFAARHPSQASRILGERAPYMPPPLGKDAILVRPPEKQQAVDMSPELEAEIVALVTRKINEMIATERLRMEILSRPLDTRIRPKAVDIVNIVARVRDIHPEDLTGWRRARRLAWPRQVAALLIRQCLPMLSYSQIGRVLGNRDHTTIMHALKRAAVYITSDPEMEQLYSRCRAEIEANWPEAFS